MKKWLISFTFLLILAACSTEDITSDQVERQQLLVEVESINRSSINETLELSGQLLPKTQVPLLTTMPLEVVKVHVEVGQAVEKGEPLIILNAEEARRQVNLAREAVEKLEQGLSQAQQINQSLETNVNHLRELEDELSKSISRSQEMIEAINPDELEGSLTEVLQASLDVSLKQAELTQAAGSAGSLAPINTIELEAQIQQANEVVRQAEAVLQSTRITAPISGIVTQLDVSAGQTAIPNQPLAIIAHLAEVDATFSVNSFQVARLSPGMSATLEVAGINEQITSEVSIVSPVVNSQTNSFPVQIPVNNDSLQLKGGMRVTAFIDLETIKEALVIPTDAILYEDGKPYTFIVEGTTVRRQPLELGTRDGNIIEILSGLSDQDQVVTSGKERLTDGAAITIQSE